MKGLAAAALLGLAAAACGWPDRPPVLPQFPERALFDAARATAESTRPLPDGAMAALVVPHHLLAADLIARGFALARHQRPDRIVMLGPDHYRRAHTLVSVNLRDFTTCDGPVPADLDGAARLLADPRVSRSNLFAVDHAFGALLPFVARQWPGVPVLAVAISARARANTWQALADWLSPLMGPRTLIVQSSDFSHYRPTAEADVCDRQTHAVIAAGDPAGASALDQPRHTDCRGGLYVTMTLARGTVADVVVTRNSAFYAGRPVESSTSYMVIAFTRKVHTGPAPTAARPPAPR